MARDTSWSPTATSDCDSASITSPAPHHGEAHRGGVFAVLVPPFPGAGIDRLVSSEGATWRR